MDNSLRLTNLIAFYFGVRVAVASPTEPAVLGNISQRAYRDLSRTLHGIGTHPDKTTLLNSTHQSLHRFTAGLETVDSQGEFDDLHETWCHERIGFFAEHPRTDREFIFTYGHAQKWLNMAMKYLAVLDHPSVQRLYPYLHVPIDTIVYNQANRIGVCRPPGGTSWSRLDGKQYLDYQNRLRARIDEQNIYSAPLDWEATIWISRNSDTDG